MTTFEWSLDGFAGATGADVRVAVVDSGIHVTHPHVAGIADAVAIGADGRPLPLTFPDDRLSDRIGHGTAVAGAIREKAPDAQLISVRIFEHQMAATGPALVGAIDWCAAYGIHIINLSLGTTNPAHAGALSGAVARALATGALVVAAAPQPDAAWLPGGLPGVVSVEADWACPRDVCRGHIDDDGAMRLVASAYPRPIPGVPPDLNFRGLSFAVANATGFLALAWPDITARTGGIVWR